MPDTKQYLSFAAALTLFACSGVNGDNPLVPVDHPGNRHPDVYIWSPGGNLVTVPVPPDVDWIVPSALTDREEIVGTVDHGGSRFTAFFWSSETGFKELAGGTDTGANGISGSGSILGNVYDEGRSNPFFWNVGGNAVQISTMPSRSFAISINPAGHVAGGMGYDAFLWTQEKGVVFITQPSDAIHSHAIAINDRDDVLLNTGPANGQTSSIDKPGLWTNGVVTQLGCTTCVVRDMNNRREVVGSVDGRAFIWRAESGVTRLATPIGMTSDAIAVNDQGDIVGWVRFGDRTQAAIWTNAGSTLVLPFAGIESRASALNSLGQVVLVWQ